VTQLVKCATTRLTLHCSRVRFLLMISSSSQAEGCVGLLHHPHLDRPYSHGLVLTRDGALALSM
jgi:hypothetical protein